MRVDKALRQAAVQEAHRRGSDLTKYITQLLVDDLYIRGSVCGYIKVKSANSLRVTASGTIELQQRETILLNRDSEQYQYNLRPDFGKLLHLFPSKRPDEIKFIEKIEVCLPQFGTQVKCDETRFPPAGGYHVIKFPKQVRGTEITVEARATLVKYLRFGRPSAGAEHVRDGYTIHIDTPTNDLSFEVQLDLGLYAQDVADKRLTEDQIAASLRVELGTIASSELKDIIEADTSRHGLQISRTTEGNRCGLRVEATPPIFGLTYRISWVAPSTKTSTAT